MKFWCIHKEYNLRDRLFKNWHYETEDQADIDFIKNCPAYGVILKAEPEPGLLPLDVLGLDFIQVHPELEMPMTRAERIEAKERNIAELESPKAKPDVRVREPNPEQIKKKMAVKAKPGYEDLAGQPFKAWKMAASHAGKRTAKDGKKREVVRNPDGPGFLIRVS